MRQASATFSLLVLSAAVSAAYAQAAPAPASAASAAEASTPSQLERVTITTGTRNAKAVDRIPGAITVIGKEEVAHTLALTEDATAVLARTVPGYAESSQAMSNTGENLRGRIALRLFDGVPQGSPLREGTRNATFTDMGVVGRIEVINGPSASEGIGAAGGIINYISKVPTKMGNEFQLITRYTTQFEDDSDGFKVGLNWFHKGESMDLVVSGSHIARGMAYDSQPRRVGPNTSGSVSDSEANNLFAKIGFDFGTDKSRRLQFSLSKFKIEGNNQYRLVDGDRATGVTNTAEKPNVPGSRAEFNDFEQITAGYRDSQFFGGTLTADLYYAKQAMRYPAENGSDRQDPLIAPLGELWDQSEIYAEKKGLRNSWTRTDFLAVEGLEFRGGVDLVEDKAQQRLALTNRLWVPPMIYRSVAPYAQLSWDVGALTLSGGLRREDGTLRVNSYKTTYFRNRVDVTGGELDYTATLPNIGAVFRIDPQWSVFASMGKGFTLPNVGIPLRNISIPGQSVDGILDLQAIIVKNKEVGVNWRGRSTSFGASFYDSHSDLGVSLSVDPVTNDFVMNRAPVTIKGFEATFEHNIGREWRFNAAYSRILGKTTFVTGGPLERRMGVNDINPDKITGSTTWRFSPQADVTLGFTKLLSRHLNVGRNNEENTRGYTLFDLGANYDFGKAGKLTLGVENLTDKFYILSWSQLPGFRNYWSGRGRTVSISHTLSF